MLQLDSPQSSSLIANQRNRDLLCQQKQVAHLLLSDATYVMALAFFYFLVWLSRNLILTDIGIFHKDTTGTICRRPLLVSTKTGEPPRRPSPGCTLSSRGLIVVLG